MKIGILGSGAVGQALAKGFMSEGHEVLLGTREPESDKATQLAAEIEGATVTDFATVAQEGELLVLCTNWGGAENTIQLAGTQNFVGKVVIDTNNPFGHDDSGVSLLLGFDNSAGESVQAWLPESHVVKCFNTVGAALMYKPEFEQKPTMFMCGNDDGAKQQVAEIVELFGWEPLDAGGIKASRQLEPMAALWVNHIMQSGDPHHAYKLL